MFLLQKHIYSIPTQNKLDVLYLNVDRQYPLVMHISWICQLYKYIRFAFNTNYFLFYLRTRITKMSFET